MGFVNKAVRVNQAGQIADGVITGAKLANDTISADKIGILDYIRSLKLDIYNDAKSDVKAQLEHDEATDYTRLRVGTSLGSLDEVLRIFSVDVATELQIGQRVSGLQMLGKAIGGLGAPAFQNDALRFGQPEIRDAEISATANISRSKLQAGALQRATGSVFPGAGGDFDITGLITPISYPSLAIGFASGDVYSKLELSSLVLKSDAGGDWATVPYASINDSGSVEGVANGHVNTVSALVASGSVKLTHRQDATELGKVISGELVVISV